MVYVIVVFIVIGFMNSSIFLGYFSIYTIGDNYALALGSSAIQGLGFATLHNVWTYAQNNLTQALNQTVNETDIQVDNQSLSPKIPGQQGGTPPKTGPS